MKNAEKNRDPERAQKRALNLGEAVYRGHRGHNGAPHPQPVSRVEALPGFGEFVAHQRELDGQHNDRDRDENPAQPPVLAAGLALLTARSRLGIA